MTIGVLATMPPKQRRLVLLDLLLLVLCSAAAVWSFTAWAQTATVPDGHMEWIRTIFAGLGIAFSAAAIVYSAGGLRQRIVNLETCQKEDRQNAKEQYALLADVREAVSRIEGILTGRASTPPQMPRFILPIQGPGGPEGSG